MLIHFAMDQITSTSSTASYTSEEARSMLGLIQDAESIGSTPYTVSLVARLMSIFVHHRFLHYHGQNGARLCHDQSVHGEKTSSRTPLITLLSPVFFNAPEVHLRGLEELWVDGLINQVKWRVFVEKLRSDWDMFIINGTVLLNANVAFLTIPDVDPGAGDPTIAKVFSFVSIIMSVGGVVLGLLLVRHHRVKVRETAEDVCGYLTSRRHPTLGLETLAILYALPYALLMWAMVTFLIAFACECFVWPFTAAIWSTAIFWVIIGSLIFWCIYTLWDWHGSALSTMRSRVADFLSHVQQRAKSAPVAFTTMCEKLPRSTPSVTTDSIRDERDVERN